MARATESEPRNTLAHEELNPLQNPLLAENINRWAEVYFSNPPDRRDAAVAELLLELEREQRQKDVIEGRVSPTPVPSAEEADIPSVNAAEKTTKCGSCGHENPMTHQFCGMCGQRVDPEKDTTTQPAEVERGRSARVMEEIERPILHEPEQIDEDPVVEGGPEAAPEEMELSERPYDDYAPAFASSDLSLFQSLRVPHDVDEEEWEYGPERSSSYRYYIAAILIIIIGGLGYLAWRSAQTSQATHEVSPPPPAAATENAQPAAQPATTAKSEPTTAPKPKNAAPPAAARDSSPTTDKSENSATQVEKASKTERLTPKPAPAHTASAGNGAEELAIAEGYLNGTSGRGRDSSQAAKWLWQAMSKHNGQATLMLADLYLKGDGVPKNCDQGRILLDSAAQRGIAGAGERLRNLQAFGCR